MIRTPIIYEDPISYADEGEMMMDETIRTRSGYVAAESSRSLVVALQQAGSESAAKCLHYSADLITSGCLDNWQKIIWDYVFDHVGIGSPRIFFFLRSVFKELDAAYAGIPAEEFYREPIYQRRIAECILVVRLCLRKPALKMPRIPPEAHTDVWVNTVFNKAPESDAVRKTWSQGLDARITYRAGNELVYAISAGSTEKALYYFKWLLEEEAFVRREHKSSLCGQFRGPASLPEKVRKSVGMYIIALCSEVYRAISSQGKLKMNEEFQALVQLYAHPDKRLSGKRRNDIIILIIQILCEVPRWSVPSAPVLVSDQAGLLRALNHSMTFFSEVLTYDPPMGNVAKEMKKKKTVNTAGAEKPMTAKEKKELKMKQQMEDMDAMITQLYGL